MTSAGVVDGWEIRRREDGSYGVYDAHGLIDGPYGHKVDAISAALRLPKPSAPRRRTVVGHDPATISPSLPEMLCPPSLGGTDA